MAEQDVASDRVVNRVIEQEMSQSYLDYAMSVIVGRALPDARDGLKPVQRRILYTMLRTGLLHSKPFRKSANIVGNCMARFHPHGDTAIYDALARMAQDFSLRYVLVDGQGNWGSLDGDNPASMRYTEAKLTKLSEELLQDIDKGTVDFVPNFDNSAKEPTVLPSKAPNLLVNGCSGIAVGMATNIPPHNMVEVCDAVVAAIKNPDITVAGLMHFIRGPDFPTGAVIYGKEGIRQAYETGRGIIAVRSKVNIEAEKGRIIVSEIPFMVNKSLMIQEIADLVRENRVRGISDLRDESSRDGIRIVIGLKKDANPDVVLNQLFKHSRLQSTFGINLVALVDNQPMLLGLKQLVCYFISHRRDVVVRRTGFDLNKAKEMAHILEGIIVALNNIDAVVDGIKKSADVEKAREFLISSYSLTEKQALAILDMRLQRLASLEQQKVRDEHKDLLELMKELAGILGSEQRIMDIVVDELEELKERYGDKRRTEISEALADFDAEDLIKQEDMIITVTHSGYIKRTPVTVYRSQHRGGKGVTAISTREQDFAEDIFIASTHSYILFFTDKGRVYWLKVYEIPEASRQSMGKAIVNLLEIKDEKLTAFIPVNDFSRGYLVMATRNGTVKKTDLQKFSNPRKGGIIAINLDENDALVSVCLTNGSNELVVATRNGKAVRFNEKNVRSSGRASMGVRGARLKDDEVIAMVVADSSKSLLTITENGFGKRSPIDDYRLISRGGSGVINIQTTERNGRVVDVKAVADTDEVIFISKNGIMIRVPVKDISFIGRNTQGSRIMKLETGDKVVAAARIVMD